MLTPELLSIDLRNRRNKDNKALILYERQVNNLHLQVETSCITPVELIPGIPAPFDPDAPPTCSMLYLFGLGKVLTSAELATMRFAGWNSQVWVNRQGPYVAMSPKYTMVLEQGRKTVLKGRISIGAGTGGHQAALSFNYHGFPGIWDGSSVGTALLGLQIPDWGSDYVLKHRPA